MIFIYGFVHSDLHPGNVAVDDEGRLILYDFGLTAELSRNDRQIMNGLFFAVANADAARLAREMVASATTIPVMLDAAVLQADCRSVIDRWSGKPSGEFSVAGLAMDLFDLQHRHGIRSTPTFAAAIWALVAYEGLVRERYPDLDFQSEAMPFLTSALLARFRSASGGGLGRSRNDGVHASTAVAFQRFHAS
jgi:ubiquinone biosynthesis protein